MITACSGLFFDHYLDLLDSLEAMNLTPNYDIGLIDLGLKPDQMTQLEARNIRRVDARWPVSAPKGQDRIEYIAFAAKPYAKEYFPGYDVYVWMDADLWAQTPAFWTNLIEGAARDGIAVPAEQDINYSKMPAIWRLWMWRHFARTYGVFKAFRLMNTPVLNNGLFACRADAPHWELWQKHFEMMVHKTRRMIAIDQLALISMLQIENQSCALLPATDNWVCSLATPWWDPQRGVFVRPGEPDNTISIMHLTTPSRERMFDVVTPDGQSERRYLYRPGGRVMAAFKRSAIERPESVITEPPIGAKHSHSKLARTP
ncbi:MAG: hypothetical protein WA888_01255 [Burkholderiaceae bacterium]